MDIKILGSGCAKCQRLESLTRAAADELGLDTTIDEVTDPGVAGTKLAWWQTEVGKAFAGQPTHPVMQALMPWTAVYGIAARHLLAVIEGCQMDLAQNRYLDYPALTRYCHLVAGVVGEVSAKIFGQTDSATIAYAHTLGQAFQLTNIIRDVGEDALRGRIYLPVSELQQFDVKAHEILNRVYSDRYGTYNALVPSTFAYNVPLPSGAVAWSPVPAMDAGGRTMLPVAENVSSPVPATLAGARVTARIRLTRGARPSWCRDSRAGRKVSSPTAPGAASAKGRRLSSAGAGAWAETTISTRPAAMASIRA